MRSSLVALLTALVVLVSAGCNSQGYTEAEKRKYLREVKGYHLRFSRHYPKPSTSLGDLIDPAPFLKIYEGTALEQKYRVGIVLQECEVALIAFRGATISDSKTADFGFDPDTYKEELATSKQRFKESLGRLSDKIAVMERAD